MINKKPERYTEILNKIRDLVLEAEAFPEITKPADMLEIIKIDSEIQKLKEELEETLRII